MAFTRARKGSSFSRRSAQGPSHLALSGSGWASRNRPASPCDMPASARSVTWARRPPAASARPPGICREWVTSKKIGAPNSFMMPKPSMSTTRLLYPKLEPRSHRMTLSLPASSHFLMMCFISRGARNWAFFTLMMAPVLAMATTRSVCRDRNAGSWMMSQTSATGAA